MPLHCPSDSTLRRVSPLRTQLKKEVWGIRCWKGKLDTQERRIPLPTKREWNLMDYQSATAAAARAEADAARKANL